MAKRLTLRERLDHYKRINTETGCHEWSGARHRDGYGLIKYQGKVQLVHRVTYEELTGPIGDLHVLHSCDNPCCYNPDHLSLGTHLDNMRDRVAKGRHKGRNKIVK